MIITENLSKSFGKITAVQNVSFTAANGAITGLLGPNGAGKSTILRMLATLIIPSKGTARVDQHDIIQNSLAVRQNIGVLPHNAGIYPRLTARENIRYYGQLCDVPEEYLNTRIDELIDVLEMQSFADRRADGFSQGQRTKVGLARALIHQPQNLLLDEPANGLDVMATRNLRTLIKQLKNQGHCILISSHIMQEVAALCDNIIIITDGRIAMQGSIENIHRQTGKSDLEDAFITAISNSGEAT